LIEKIQKGSKVDPGAVIVGETKHKSSAVSRSGVSVGGTEYPPELGGEALGGVIPTNNVIRREDPYRTFKLGKSKEPFKVLLLQLARMRQQY